MLALLKNRAFVYMPYRQCVWGRDGWREGTPPNANSRIGPCPVSQEMTCIYARWKILKSAAARAWETPSLTTVRRRHAEGSIVEARDKTTHVD